MGTVLGPGAPHVFGRAAREAAPEPKRWKFPALRALFSPQPTVPRLRWAEQLPSLGLCVLMPAGSPISGDWAKRVLLGVGLTLPTQSAARAPGGVGELGVF